MFARRRQSSDRPFVPIEGWAGRYSNAGLVAFVALAAVYGLAGQGAAAPLVRADDAILWIVQPDVPLGEADPGIRLIHTRVGSWFSPRARFPLRRGQIYCAAVVDGQLHAFFRDGTYYSFRRTEARQGVPTARAVQQQRLPGSFLPLAVAGHPADGTLLAVVPTHIALRIIEENTRRERLLADEDQEDEEGPATRPEAAPTAIDPTSGGYWLIKYAPRRWEPVEALPEFFNASVSARLALSDTTMALAWRPPGPGIAAELQYAQLVGEQWSRPETIPGSGELEGLSLGLLEEEPVLVGLRPDPADAKAAQVKVLRRRAGAWEAAGLSDPGGAALSLPSDRSGSAMCGGQVVVVVAEDAETARWGLWPIEGGGPQEDFRPVPRLKLPGSSVLGGRWSQILSYLCLVFLFITVFWRRQASLLRPAELPSGFGPAGLTRRAAGFVLDFLPAVAVTAPMWAEPWRELADALIEYGEQPEQIEPFLEKLWVPSLLVRGVYAAYCLGWELWRGSTPGKMAMRCGVCGLSGRPCTRRQLVVRNLFRIIELEPLLLVGPLLLLLVISRNRQRLGDMWACTLVVERLPATPTSGPMDDR